MFDVIILAGTAKQSALTEAEKVKNKAFIKLKGQTMLGYVLNALREMGQIGRIAVVAPVEDLAPFVESDGILVVQEAGSITENIHEGFKALLPSRHFLLVSADIPLLTAEAVNNFLELCRPYNEDFYYPIVNKEDNEASFPGVERTYVTLREGVYTGGNLFLVNPKKVEDALPRVEKFISLRKSPLRLAAALGVGFIFKFMTKRLTITALEKRFSEIFGLSGKAVISKYPEIGTDVDKLSDLELVRRVL